MTKAVKNRALEMIDSGFGLDIWEETVAKHLDGISVSEAKPSQLENLHAIYEELEDFLSQN